MPRVLLSGTMDEVRRAVVEERARGAFEPIYVHDLSVGGRDAAWATADVLVCEGFRPEIPEDLATRAPHLRLIQLLIAGVNQVPFERIPDRVVVCSNAGAFNVSVAEHAMALLLASSKDVVRRTDEVRRGIFDQTALSKPLRGSALLVLGLGGIGAEVARLAGAFGMRVLGISRGREPFEGIGEVGTLEDLDWFLPRADYVLVALPLTRATEGLIDGRRLGLMKPDAVLVNIARGKIVVEDDLFEHLRTHPGFRAALDVWWTYPAGDRGRPFRRPFHDLPNVVMTPHVAFANPTQRRHSMEAALENVVRLLRGEPPRNVVDPREYT